MRQDLLLFQLLDVTGKIIDIEQLGRIWWQLKAAFLPCSNKHGGNLSQRTTHQFLKAVPPCPRQEHDESDNDGQCTNAVTPSSSEVILYVHKDSDGKEGANADEEEEPVEEVNHLGPLGLVWLIELVWPEPGYTGLEPARAQGDSV